MADHAAPGRQVVAHRGLAAAHLEDAALGHALHVLADQQHQARAAVEVAAVEDVVGVHVVEVAGRVHGAP